MKNNVITVIIPVYNGEKTIKKCLKSILTIEGVNAIVVDDGSTDGTLEIIKSVKEHYSNLKIITQVNLGASVARNVGLKKVNTKYVTFCDADDYYDQIDLVSMIDSEKDLNVFSFKYEGNIQYSDNSIYSKAFNLSTEEYFLEMNKYFSTLFFGVVWNKVYKTSIINEYNIEFPLGVTIGEDVIFNLEYLKHISGVRIRTERYCNHCLRNDSLSASVDEESAYRDLTTRLDKMESLGEYFGLDISGDNDDRRAIGLISVISYIVKNNCKSKSKEKMIDIFSRKRVLECLKNYKGDNKTLKWIYYCSRKKKWGLLFVTVRVKETVRNFF